MDFSRFRQNPITHRALLGVMLVASLTGTLGSCSNLQVVESTPLPRQMAPALDLPHPTGFGVQELKGLFLSQGAPDRGLLDKCSSDLELLMSKTQLREEVRDGARELVAEDPETLHWCFYGKLLSLEEGIKSATDLDARQRLTLSTFKVLVPIARGFQFQFKDSRYLRWAIQRYRAISPFVFYRKVEMTSEATVEMAMIENTFGAWKVEPSPQAILTKYGIRKPGASTAAAAELPEELGASGSPPPETARTPAAAPQEPGAGVSDEEVSKIFQEIESQ